ncbi:transcriptional regulator [Crossiella sp. CA198]|uniref:transcriptional regulator n=1 Tax=Crossiella sp. CA198 TaxID=3455607 RepID=UPI003F8D1989
MPPRTALRLRRAQLEREWARCVANRAPGANAAVPPEVTQSWARALPAVSPARDSAPSADARWQDSPLREPVLACAAELRGIAEDAGYVAAVADAQGTILWTFGGRVMRGRAERVNFAVGGRWSEAAMGTNALSLALDHNRPASCFSAEHLVQALHGWVCYSAPVHAPNGQVLGVLDLSTTWDRSHPLAMPTVRGLVTALEARLAESPLDLAPAGWSLHCLGRGELLDGGAPVPLRPRQLEILTLLTLHPDGLTPELLQDALYADRPVHRGTLKAEVSHLRRALRGGVTTRSYHLGTPVRSDARAVLDALSARDLTTALRHYRGPLLPESEAPGIREWREVIEVALREAVLQSPQPDHLLSYLSRHPYDLQAHQHALARLDPADARRGVVLARLRKLLPG